MSPHETSRAARPAPSPSPETAPFWEAAARGALSLQVCPRCEDVVFPPAARCPHCLSEDIAWRELSGRGRLRSWTALYIPAFPGSPKPTLIVEVEPDEGRTTIIPMLAEAADESALVPGAPVAIRFGKDANGWSFPFAVPAGLRE